VQRSAPRAVVVADQAFGALSSPRRGSAEVELLPAAEHLLRRLASGEAKVAIVLPQGVPKARELILPVDAHIVPALGTPARTLATCAKAIGTLEDGLLVAADRVFRGAGAAHGCRVASHPLLAELVLDDCEPVFLRMSGGRPAIDRLDGFVPYWLERSNDEEWTALGAGPPRLAVDAVRAGVRVDVLALELALEDPLIVRLEAGTPPGRVVASGNDWALYALGPEDSVDAVPAHGTHGHFVALAPGPQLRAAPPADGRRQAEALLARWPRALVDVERIDDLFPLVLGCSGTSTTFQADVDRYAGAAPLNGGAVVASRHSAHPDNPRCVEALLDDLRGIGYCATTHAFSHGGKTLHNVIADLPGTGFYRIPKILLELREVLRHWPPNPPWEKVRELLGDSFTNELRPEQRPPWEAKQILLNLAGLEPWIIWRLRRCPLPGLGAELVLIGCHLDSTAARDVGYNPASGSARGADDDASGIAAVLAAARGLWKQRGKLKHTIRFCFFNAEESGLVGSQAYAAALKAWSAPVRAVVCVDMIGFNTDANRVFEIHAGATDPAVRDASVPIAQSVSYWAAALGALGAAQIYQGTNAGGGSDRLVYDGAIGRSDHASFQQQGYPAVVVSEDFFVNLPVEPAADTNPNYHRAADTVIDAAYGSDIACAITRAVQELAA
jgi:hypothetical protein